MQDYLKQLCELVLLVPYSIWYILAVIEISGVVLILNEGYKSITWGEIIIVSLLALLGPFVAIVCSIIFVGLFFTKIWDRTLH